MKIDRLSITNNKRLSKIVAVLMTAVLLISAFTACGTKTGDTQVQSTETSSPAASTQVAATTVSASVFPLTVKDAGGYETTITEKPVKIVSLTLGTDEMLLDIVDKSRIASLTPYADDPGVSNIADKVKDIPTRLKSEAEKVLALQPDLVFIDTWADENFVKQLRNAKIPVYVFKTPSNIEEQINVVREVAHVVGEDAKGEEIVSWMNGILGAVDEKVKTLSAEQRLTVLDYSEMGSTSGKGTNFDDIITRAGLVNSASKAGLEGWPNLSKEKIVEWNPDIILIPSWYYDKSKDINSLSALIKNDKTLQTVNAVKNDKILALPYNHMSAISQYVVLGVQDAAKAAYPDLFK